MVTAFGLNLFLFGHAESLLAERPRKYLDDLLLSLQVFHGNTKCILAGLAVQAGEFPDEQPAGSTAIPSSRR